MSTLVQRIIPSNKAVAQVLSAWAEDWEDLSNDLQSDPSVLGVEEGDDVEEAVIDHIGAAASTMVANMIEAAHGTRTQRLVLIASANPAVEQILMEAALFLSADSSAPDVMNDSEAQKFRERAGRCPPGYHYDVEDEKCEPSDSQEKVEKATGAVADYAALGSLIDSGKLKGTIDEHNKIAKDFIAKHKAGLKQTLDDIKALAPEGASVKGRAKTVASAVGKLARKPKYGTADKLQDGSGFRVVLKGIKDVDSVAEGLKKKYKIVDEDRYIDKSNGEGTPADFGYRSHHLIVETPDGLQKEIQVRTENQNKHAEWCHDAYKPQTDEQRKVIMENEDAVREYAIAMGKYFFDIDSGKKPGKKPVPAPEVAAAFGTL